MTFDSSDCATLKECGLVSFLGPQFLHLLDGEKSMYSTRLVPEFSTMKQNRC